MQKDWCKRNSNDFDEKGKAQVLRGEAEGAGVV